MKRVPLPVNAQSWNMKQHSNAEACSQGSQVTAGNCRPVFLVQEKVMTQSYAAVKLETHLLMHKGLQLLEEARGDAGQVLLSLMMRMMYNTSHISSN